MPSPLALRAVAAGLCLLASVTTGYSLTATPPDRLPPQRERNGLTARERATLFSRDADSLSLAGAPTDIPATRVANATDVTFTRPPTTAARWTRNDSRDLPRTGANLSVYPSHATLADGTYIRDAHATVFGSYPSTRLHRSTARPLYVAPNLTVRAFVDYRVQVPANRSGPNRTVTWHVRRHEIEQVWLTVDARRRDQAPGSHRVTLRAVSLAGGKRTLTVGARISVTITRVTRRRVRVPNETDPPRNRSRNATRTPTNGTTNATTYEWQTTRTTVTETITVRDRRRVVVYRPQATLYQTTYPNGDHGIALQLSAPWQGGRLDDGGTAIRGIWRYFTARDTRWDRLTYARQNGTTRRVSPARPVYVHAYPSTIGAKLVGQTRATRIDLWGARAASPSLSKRLAVGAVTAAYTRTLGVAIRTPNAPAIHLSGLVRGVTPTLHTPSDRAVRQLRPVNVSTRVVPTPNGTARLRITLRDAETGAPIRLTTRRRLAPIGDTERRGYLTVAGEIVRTNTSGVVTVRLPRPGVYTVQYHPGSWLTHDPAYAPTATTVRWLRLTDPASWPALLGESLTVLVPVGLIWLVSRELRRILPGRRGGYR